MIVSRSEYPPASTELPALVAHRLRTQGAGTLRSVADYVGAGPFAVAESLGLFEQQGCVERIRPVGLDAPDLEFFRWVTDRDDACCYQQDLF